MKKHLVWWAFVAFPFCAQAQIGVGAQLNWSKYFGEPGFIGLGANGTFVIAEKFPLRTSLNFGLPRSSEGELIGNRLSSDTEPSSISVKYTEKISLLNFWVDAQKYFGRRGYETGGFYVMAGFGYTLASFKYDIESYNTSLYDVGFVEDQRVGQLGIRGGCGYDIDLDFGNLFFETGLNLSANQANDQAIAVNLPSFLFVNAGLRFWITD